LKTRGGKIQKFIFFLAIALIAGAQRVSRVIDGDTLAIENRGSEVKIRLHCIDAPEKKQDFGSAATRALKRFALNKEAQIKVITTDRYKRKVAIVTIDDENINLKMVKEGYAWAFAKYCDDRAYFDAQAEAKAQMRGLWKDKNPIYPADFRSKR
jgi:endonuclease YncB( thermonuclease family)